MKKVEKMKIIKSEAEANEMLIKLEFGQSFTYYLEGSEWLYSEECRKRSTGYDGYFRGTRITVSRMMNGYVSSIEIKRYKPSPSVEITFSDKTTFFTPYNWVFV